MNFKQSMDNPGVQLKPGYMLIALVVGILIYYFALNKSESTYSKKDLLERGGVEFNLQFNDAKRKKSSIDLMFNHLKRRALLNGMDLRGIYNTVDNKLRIQIVGLSDVSALKFLFNSGELSAYHVDDSSHGFKSPQEPPKNTFIIKNSGGHLLLLRNKPLWQAHHIKQVTAAKSSQKGDSSFAVQIVLNNDGAKLNSIYTAKIIGSSVAIVLESKGYLFNPKLKYPMIEHVSKRVVNVVVVQGKFDKQFEITGFDADEAKRIANVANMRQAGIAFKMRDLKIIAASSNK